MSATEQQSGPGYLNFDIVIGEQTEAGYPVRVTPPNQKALEGVIPADELGDHLRRTVRTLRRTRSVKSSRGREKVEQDEVPEEPDVQALGMHLFDLLMKARPSADRSRDYYLIRENYHSTLAGLNAKGLRLRLRIDAPELRSIPWEYLHDTRPDEHERFLAVNPRTPFLRFPVEVGVQRRTAPDPPLRILGMVASPSSQVALNVDKEKRRMEEAVERARRGKIDLVWLETLEGSRTGQSACDLRSAMKNHGPWHVFHYIGHGGFDEAKGMGELLLTNPDDGKEDPLFAEDLADILQWQSSNLHFVVLNSCETAKVDGTKRFSSTASYLVKNGIPAVLSMQYEITDKAAIEFSEALYHDISELVEIGHPVVIDEVLVGVRQRLKKKIEAAEWGTPVLHTGLDDGILFERVNWEASEGLAESPDLEPAAAPTGTLTPEDLISLRSLAGKVKTQMEDEARDSPLAENLRKLGLKSESIQVDGGCLGHEISTSQTIGEIFRGGCSRLLIIGEPGSGKTHLVWKLVGELLDSWGKDTNHRVPVVFRLSDWDSSASNLEDWLVAKFKEIHQLGPVWARRFLKEARFTLILDGLDVVHPAHRPSCVDAINEYSQQPAGHSMVVTSRIKEYADLSTKLALGAAVRIQDVTKADVIELFDQADSRLQALVDALKDDSSFQVVLSSRALLGMAFEAYKGLSPMDLASDELATVQDRVRQIMKAYAETPWDGENLQAA